MRIDSDNTILAKHIVLNYVQKLNSVIMFHIYITNSQMVNETIIVVKCIEEDVNITNKYLF